MIKDICNMSQEEKEEKFRIIYQKVREENARFGLPVTGYSNEYKCIIQKYIDGRIDKVERIEDKIIYTNIIPSPTGIMDAHTVIDNKSVIIKVKPAY